MHQNPSFTTPDGKKYLFWKKVSGSLGVCENASKHVFNHSRRSKISLLKKRFWRSGSMRKCHQKLFFKKRYFWTSGVVKNVFWCICAYLQTTRNFFSKKIFLTILSLEVCANSSKHVFNHSRRSKISFFEKKILAVWKYEFVHTSRPPETFFQ